MWLPPLLLESAQNAATDPLFAAWPQYGAMGLLVVGGAFAIRRLDKRSETQADEAKKAHAAELERLTLLHAQERERVDAAHAAEVQRLLQVIAQSEQRADRMEGQVLELNKLANDMAGKIVRATEVLYTVAGLIGGHRNRGED